MRESSGNIAAYAAAGKDFAMKCPVCGAENDPGRTQCTQCGASLSGERAFDNKEEHASSAEEDRMHAAEENDASSGDGAGKDPHVVFCPRCGTRSAAGTNFCLRCGAPLPGGAVYTAAGSNEPGVFAGLGSYLADAFRRPVSAVLEAKEEHFVYGILVVLIKALLEALIMLGGVRMILSALQGAFGSYGWLFSALQVRSGSLFFASFLSTLIMDALILFLALGLSRAFGSKWNLKKWLAAFGSIQVLCGAGGIVSELLCMCGKAGIVLAAILSIAMAAAFVVLMYRAFTAGMKEKVNKGFYGYLVAAILVVIVLVIVVAVITAVMAAGAYNYVNMNNNMW